MFQVEPLSWLLFFTSLFAAVALPGPGVLVVVGRSLHQGFKKTVPMICGIALGDVTLLLVALFGVSGFLLDHKVFFGLLQIPLALYFCWSAKTFFVEAWARRTAFDGALSREDKSGVSALRAGKDRGRLGIADKITSAMAGYVLTLSNPKALFFYLGLLPLVLPVGGFGVGDYMLVSLMDACILMGILGAYAAFASRLLKGAGLQAWFPWLYGFSGLVFATLALGLVWSGLQMIGLV